jgi:ribosome-associated protein
VPSNPISRIVKALEDKKGIHVQVLDMRPLVSYTDYLVLCTGSSFPHMNALVDNVEESLRTEMKPVHFNSSKDKDWIILDYGDVVIHVFSENVRSFYDLERLWCDAPRIAPGKAV